MPRVRGNRDVKGAKKVVAYIMRNTGTESEENKMCEVLYPKQERTGLGFDED